MSALLNMRFVAVGVALVVVIAGIAFSSAGDPSATAGPANAQTVPSFSELATAGSEVLAPEARAALADAGLSKDATVSVAEHGKFKVVVARDDRIYIALINNATQSASISYAPTKAVETRGTWVATADASENGSTTLAILVPDGVGSVQVTDTDGTKSSIDVDGNIAFIQSKTIASAEYRFDGANYVAEPAPSPRR